MLLHPETPTPYYCMNLCYVYVRLLHLRVCSVTSESSTPDTKFLPNPIGI